MVLRNLVVAVSIVRSSLIKRSRLSCWRRGLFVPLSNGLALTQTSRCFEFVITRSTCLMSEQRRTNRNSLDPFESHTYLTSETRLNPVNSFKSRSDPNHKIVCITVFAFIQMIVLIFLLLCFEENRYILLFDTSQSIVCKSIAPKWWHFSVGNVRGRALNAGERRRTILLILSASLIRYLFF